MELTYNMNRHQQRTEFLRSKGPLYHLLDDDDNSSVNSRVSFFSQNNRDTGETEKTIATVNVRDMIRKYNSTAEAAKASATLPFLKRKPQPIIKNLSTQTMPSPKSFYPFNKQIQEPVSVITDKPCTHERNFGELCRNCSTPINDSSEQRKIQNLRFLDRSLSFENKRYSSPEPIRRITRSPPKSVENPADGSILILSNNCENLDKTNDIDYHSETTYQSKTTISKTEDGVRIVIDIFFDDQNIDAKDVIGSRVETDIPDSRILTEFEQQIMSTPMKSCENLSEMQSSC